MVSLFAFILFPIIGLPIYMYYYIFDKNKEGLFYSAIIGLTLGIFAYYFIPKIDYDLYRHQMVVSQLKGLSFSQFLMVYKDLELEFIPSLYSYIISLTNNFDLLQFFVVSLGYSILFYILYDYRKISGINTIPFIFTVLVTIFGFNTLYFISGLYYYIAVILFALAFYNEYVKKSNKIICYLLYILTIFIHNSMAFALLVLFIYKFFRNKFNLKSISICIIIFALSFYVLNFLTINFDISFFKTIQNMYNSYVTKDASLKRLYSGIILFIEITKLVITILCIFTQKEKHKFDGVNGFILLLSLSTVIMMIRSRVMIRFVMLVQFIGIVPMMDSFKGVRNNKLILLMIVIMLSIIYILYFYLVFRYQSFGLLHKNIFKNIFEIFNKVIV